MRWPFTTTGGFAPTTPIIATASLGLGRGLGFYVVPHGRHRRAPCVHKAKHLNWDYVMHPTPIAGKRGYELLNLLRVEIATTQLTAPQEAFDTDKVRTLIAEYLGIDPKRVRDEAHFSDEFGMDRYDRLELMILIEDAFTGVEFTDDDTDQIEVVGDIIRHIEGNNERRSRKLIRLT